MKHEKHVQKREAAMATIPQSSAPHGSTKYVDVYK